MRSRLTTVEQEGRPGLKTLPWAWVELLFEVPLPRVVTVLREDSLGCTGSRREEQVEDWIEQGQVGPYTDLRRIVAE